MTISVRQLNEKLTGYLRRANSGERVIVTRRGKPYAVISPPAVARAERPTSVCELAKRLRGLPGLAWNGTNLHDLRLSAPRKLTGSGPAVSEMIIKERRGKW